MQPFQLKLSDGKVVSGLHSLPTSVSPKHLPTPLIVALHGGTYTSKYFDVDDNHTASLVSIALGVPFVAIDRPGYDVSTAFSSIPEGSSYAEESAIWLHLYVLPALWSKYGVPNRCNCVILHAHSLGSVGAIIAAGLHAKDARKLYPLGGISMSGFGSQPTDSPVPLQDFGTSPIVIPSEMKDKMMLQRGHASPEVYKYTDVLNHPMPVEEMASAGTVWFPRWRELAAAVSVAVMVGFAGHDLMWHGTKEHLQEFTNAFTASERVDGSVITGAPHNLEMSYWTRGWYARCFGFALECAMNYEHRDLPVRGSKGA
jgi:pimeloyl-ACP methyl ester carboxylesterase